MPAGRESPSALKPTAAAMSGSTPLPEGVADARPAMGRCTALSEGAACAQPSFEHQLVPSRIAALERRFPLSKGVCGSFDFGGHGLASRGGRIFAGVGDVASSLAEYRGVAAPATATWPGSAAETDTSVSICSPQSGISTSTDRGDEACRVPFKAASQTTGAKAIGSTVSQETAATAIGGSEHAGIGIPHGSGGVPARSVPSRPAATHEGAQAGAKARMKEALLRRAILRAEILHHQFRGSEGAGTAVRGDDELSRVYLAGEREALALS